MLAEQIEVQDCVANVLICLDKKACDSYRSASVLGAFGLLTVLWAPQNVTLWITKQQVWEVSGIILTGMERLPRKFGANVPYDRRAENCNFKRKSVKFHVQTHLWTLFFDWTWRYTPVISAIVRQADHRFVAMLDYIVKPELKNKQKEIKISKYFFLCDYTSCKYIKLLLKL